MPTDFLMYDNVHDGIQPVDFATTTKSTPWVDLKLAHNVAFLVNFGVITATSANNVTITVEASTTNDSTTAVAVPFLYRQSSVTTANTWGAVTSCTTVGLVIAAATATGTNLWVEVDMATVATEQPTARWLKMQIDGGEGTACLAAVTTFIHPRYHNLTMYSAT